MSSRIAEVSAWLQQAALTTQDTLIMRTVAPEPGWFETVSSIAQSLVSITLLVLAVALVPAAWNFRKSYKRVNDLLDRVYADINPITRHVSAIADNVDYITTSIRADIQQVNETVALANERLRHALAASEARLREFNALLRVVQEEAEDAFVSTAATVRGVRAGAAAMGSEPADAERHADELDDARLDVDDLEDDGLEDDPEHEEELDGYDDAYPPGSRQPGPRIRRRSRRRRD
ncbi:MAG TPA: DUF948 domain-containing protein [Gemmatimonadaceae bacterium]|nr:DUF948 domain-containing protein [Gemmatimonadaceae bacterium]